MFDKPFEFLKEWWTRLSSFFLNMYDNARKLWGVVIWAVMGVMWAFKWLADTIIGLIWYVFGQLQSAIETVGSVDVQADLWDVFEVLNYVMPVKETIVLVGMYFSLILTLVLVRWVTRWIPWDFGK